MNCDRLETKPWACLCGAVGVGLGSQITPAEKAGVPDCGWNIPSSLARTANPPVVKLCLTSDIQNCRMLSSLLATKLSSHEPQITNTFF